MPGLERAGPINIRVEGSSLEGSLVNIYRLS
jgi:hypothetical protein